VLPIPRSTWSRVSVRAFRRLFRAALSEWGFWFLQYLLLQGEGESTSHSAYLSRLCTVVIGKLAIMSETWIAS
jgi:hypothetical protein